MLGCACERAVGKSAAQILWRLGFKGCTAEELQPGKYTSARLEVAHDSDIRILIWLFENKASPAYRSEGEDNLRDPSQFIISCLRASPYVQYWVC